jgi:signal transduction histidine kinase
MASSLFKKENMGELILVILLIIYLVLGFKTPAVLSQLLHSVLGKLVVFLIVLYLFMHSHPILAILALYTAFHIISNSNMNMNTRAMQKFLPSETNKMSQFSAFNQFPYTLEQEVVKKMAPIVMSGTTLTAPSYHPIVDNIHDATNV